MSALAQQLQFSQSNLQDYVDCARRFELRYLMRLRYPAVEAEPIDEHEQHVQMGEEFHRLVNQHLIGIPVDKLTRAINDDTLKQWWMNYLQYGLTDLPTGERYPELKLYTSIGGYRLMAKYDLLAFNVGEKFVIMDWKTSHQRTKRDVLMRRLQTIVYRYVLVEAGKQFNRGVTIQPEQVEMVYWFPQYPQQPEKFNYDHEQHEQARNYLTNLMDEIQTRSQYELTPNLLHCRYCKYRSLCERGTAAGNIAAYEVDEKDDVLVLFDFDQIAEIEF
jgi:CRISPR/Cas system-associated exonuclease Cas4 (RecB family)